VHRHSLIFGLGGCGRVFDAAAGLRGSKVDKALGRIALEDAASASQRISSRSGRRLQSVSDSVQTQRYDGANERP
jgi:hypothetical protein